MPVRGFPIGGQGIGVHGLIVLPRRRIDSRLPKEPIHAKGAGLVRHDGHYVTPKGRILQERAQQAHHGHGGGELPFPGPLEERLEGSKRRYGEGFAVHLPPRQGPAEGLAPRPQVGELRRRLLRAIKIRSLRGLPGQRNAQAPGKIDPFLRTQIFLLVHRIPALGAGPHAIALHGFRENHHGLTHGAHGFRVGGVELLHILAATLDGGDLFVRKGVHEGFQRRSLLHPVLPLEGAGGNGVHLVVPIEGLFHALGQMPRRVPGQQRIPPGAPNHLDDVPIGAAEAPFEFLNNFPIAAHGPI